MSCVCHGKRDLSKNVAKSLLRSSLKDFEYSVIYGDYNVINGYTTPNIHVINKSYDKNTGNILVKTDNMMYKVNPYSYELEELVIRNYEYRFNYHGDIERIIDLSKSGRFNANQARAIIKRNIDSDVNNLLKIIMGFIKEESNKQNNETNMHVNFNSDYDKYIVSQLYKELKELKYNVILCHIGSDTLIKVSW